MRYIPMAVLAGLLATRAVAQCPDGSPPPCRTATRAAAAPSNSVAVLFFENLSRDSADAYLADGLTEEITSQLGQIGRLVVASRTNTRRLRTQAASMSAAEIGRALNAIYLVNGSVRRAGARLRVSVELLRASTGVQVWASQFDRGADDLLAIQEDIALAVAAEIVGQLLPGERARLQTRPTRNPEAYDLYLRGSHAFTTVSSEGLQEAIAAFETALRLDPGFAAARGRIAYAYGWAVNWDIAIAGVPPESLISRGLLAADAALRADSLSSDAWAGRGWLLFFRDPPDYHASLASLARATQLDSGNALAHQNLAAALRRVGEYDASLREYRRSLSPGPTFSQSLADVGFIALSRRQWAESRRWYDSALAVNPGAWNHYTFRARARLELGDTAGALDDAAEAARRSSAATRARAVLVQVEIAARSGRVTEARARLESVIGALLAADGPVSVRTGWELAAALAATGQADRAVAVLERIRPRGAWLWSYLVFSSFDVLRSDPRFQRLYAEIRPAGVTGVP
jgi:TolB-like protein/Tfp pilus assembly protein PilF